MASRNISRRYFRLLRFEDSKMEQAYQTIQKDLDTKLFFIFGIITLLAMILTGSLMIAFTKINHTDLIVTVVQMVLPLVGLLLRKRFEFVSKCLILMSLPLGFIAIKSLINGNISSDLSKQGFFIFGNNIGLVEIILMSNIQSMILKFALALGFLVIKLIIAEEGYIKAITNLVVVGVILFFLFLSFFYQEILARRRFKSTYKSQEKLRKFQSLLSDDFPTGVLIMTADFCSVLYSNMFFKNHFIQEQYQEQNSKIIDSIFKDFEIEMDSISFELEDSNHQLPMSLSRFVRYLSKNHIHFPENDLLTLPAVYKNTGNTMSFHYEIKIRKITWDQISSYALIFNDVSERQMVTALKLADQHKDRIIATISHELRTPINGTVGLLEMISARVTDEVSQTYLTYCKNCSKLLLYLVNSILDLCQLKDGFLTAMKTSFSLEELLDEIKSLYLYQCQAKEIELVVEMEKCVSREIYTDRHRLTEILINLIGNAIKFTFHGSVTLQVTGDEHDATRLKFSIIDTGIGIKEEDKPKLFKRFGKIQQRDASVNIQGVGLGLTIVQELVNVLNNSDGEEKVIFASKYGIGSTFSFRILYVQEEIRSQQFSSKKSLPTLVFRGDSLLLNEFNKKEEHVEDKIKHYELNLLTTNRTNTGLNTIPEQNTPLYLNKDDVNLSVDIDYDNNSITTRKNVLIVDDNPFNILAASFVLEKLNYQIGKAFNGQECLDLLQYANDQEKFYDLILMDIQMPVLDGLETARMISTKVSLGELKCIPIIALTAKHITEEDVKYYMSCGMIAVLEKPLNEIKLIETINSTLVTNHN